MSTMRMSKPKVSAKAPRQTILSGVPGMTAWNDLKHKKYTGQIQDFKGQLRCHTGTQHMGKDVIILIRPEQLEAKKLKYPNLNVIEIVQ